ncbi:MAG: YrhB family protein [Pyrinomonadaceae bacterium]|nr:YrhB family protein [Pyrinomonadaceae bacterium]
MTRPYGWVFFYQRKQYLTEPKFEHMLVGNAPIIVDRIDGELRVTGTAKPTEEYLTEYEATLPVARLKMRPEFPPKAI